MRYENLHAHTAAVVILFLSKTKDLMLNWMWIHVVRFLCIEIKDQVYVYLHWLSGIYVYIMPKFSGFIYFKKLKLWIIVLITCLICLIVLHINQLLRIRECLKINWYNDAYTLIFLACRKGWTLFAGYCYYFSAIGTTWNQAEVIPLLLSITVLSVAYSRNIRV